ncbi:uncharacterized protein LOC143447133 [Clavelina lepadiformis]|uniref:SF-assemblin n=1 Tax=Clavelina lepadiformis TaxID=159417 RepID=A0ABP0GTH2_CLALP
MTGVYSNANNDFDKIKQELSVKKDRFSAKDKMKYHVSQTTVADTSPTQQEKAAEANNSFNIVKNGAEEQGGMARETRERKLGNERQSTYLKRQEELRLQIRSELESLLVDVRRDILLLLQERINEEKGTIKADLKRDLQATETNLIKEVENKVADGEPFNERVAKLQREFESSFNIFLKSELIQLQEDVLSDIDTKLQREKQQWEERFTRDIDRRLKPAEEAIRKEFREGLNDSQKHCSDILHHLGEKNASLEKKMSEKISSIDGKYHLIVQESAHASSLLTDQKIEEQAATIVASFETQFASLRDEMTEARLDITHLKSKCCNIL